MRQNKKARFWIRFLAKTIDTLIVGTILVGILLPNIEIKGNIEFKDAWNFYVWSASAIVVLFSYFYLLPVLTNGKTIGNYVTKTKIKYSKNKYIEQAKRESMFSFIYIINIIFMMLIINHSLISYIVSKKAITQVHLNNFEKIRISFYVTISSVGILISAVVGISIIIKKGNGLNDTISGSQAIYINRFKNVLEQKKKFRLKPTPVKEHIIEWIE